ncbi:MAG: hypothetical protein COB02_03965 [Candidatus Cloacimonadota bacterium]|nr:MAG: hypothetical protein COB02_03965 [Candidatus Cloacimonadota bacterium]
MISLSVIDKMRPKNKQVNLFLLRENCGKAFYKKYHSKFVEVPCPSCSKNGEKVYQKYGYKHLKCENCLTVWCSPRPTGTLLSEYYASSESTKLWTSILVETDVDRKVLQYEPRVNQLIRLLKKDKKFRPKLAVDLGAGSGAFALSLQNKSYFSEVIAVDFEENCCNVCNKNGLKTIKGSIDDLEDNLYSLITMNDMIEHLFNPLDFLSKCNKVLTDNGYISIACPNGEGFDFKLMKEKTVNITPPEHLNYFNPESIKLLLESTGFEVVLLETPGILDVSIIKREINQKNIDLSKNKFIEDLLINGDDETLNSFQSFLRENKLSSHMLVIAKKIN